MASRKLFAALLAAAIAAAAGCATSSPPGPSSDGAQIDAVIDSIRAALNEAQTNNAPGFPPLKSVTISLQTTASRSAGGEIRFLVATLGAKYSSETASTVELEMVPPKTRDTERTVMTGPDVKEALAKAIGLAKVGVLKASGGSPPLSMKKISIDLNGGPVRHPRAST